MKNFFTVVFLSALLLPLSASAEVIHNFDTDIAVQTDGSFTVTEQIFYDFETEDRHGIFRTIPTTHPQSASAWYKERYIRINVTDVHMDNREVPYTVTSRGERVEIKIGDPDILITGEHMYTVVYDVAGALFRTASTTELYWNVTGNEWQVPIEKARAIVHTPTDSQELAYTCYVGEPGENGACEASKNDSVTVFESGLINAGEEFTVAQALNPRIPVVILETLNLRLLIPLIALLLFVGLPIWRYKVLTKHKINGPIIAEYEPYQHINPLYAGMLIDNKLHARDITAAIIYVAEEGILKIKRLEKKFWVFTTHDYEIRLIKDPAEITDSFLKEVLKLIFGESVKIGEAITLSDIKTNFPKQRVNQQILRDLRKTLKKDMEQEGFFEATFHIQTKTYILGIAGFIGLLVVLNMLNPSLAAVGLFGGFALFAHLIFMFKRRTHKGYEAMNHLKGFKEFLRVTGKDRFTFHNAPAKSPEQFLEFLPYAIAFGVEKEWAEVFRDITIPNPGWYEGGGTGVFSAAAFTSDMSTFSSSLSTSAGTSAASGGGSAGGGAGGGGGGSW